MPKVFVSYRRADAREAAVRIADELVDEFDDASVFFDTETIEPGKSFPSEIMTNIGNSTHVLVVIGPDWLVKNAETGIARIEEPEDWVRREIRTALTSQATVIPVLVNNAQMPGTSELPLDLRSLCEQNAVELRPDRFKGSLAELIDRLRDQSVFRAAMIVFVACVIAAAIGLTLQALFNMFHGLFESVQQTQRAISDLATTTGAEPPKIDPMGNLATSTGIHISGNFGTALQLSVIAFGAMLAALSYLPLARSKIPLSVVIGFCAYVGVEFIAFMAGAIIGTEVNAILQSAVASSAKLSAMTIGLLWPHQRNLKLNIRHIALMAAVVFVASMVAVMAVHMPISGTSLNDLVQSLPSNPVACITASVYVPCDADAEAVQVVLFVTLALLFAALIPGTRVSLPRLALFAVGWTAIAVALILFRKAVFMPLDFFADAKLGTAVICAAVAFNLARWKLRRGIATPQ